MKKYPVNITPHASNMLAQIYEYIAFELLEPDYAAKQFTRLQEKIQSLNTMPKRCKIYSKTLYPKYELRRLLVDNYSIFYYIDKDIVTVTDILYSHADIAKRLKNI
jgi:plasmid stabilization system protein ParE